MKKRLLAMLLVLILCLTACDLPITLPDPEDNIPGDSEDNTPDNPEDNIPADPEDSAISYEDITPSKYIEIADDDYKGFDLQLNIYDDTDVQLEKEIIGLLNAHKPKESFTNADENYVPVITAGDDVYIYYRGYILNDDGTRNYMDNMSNVNSTSPYKLTIGSGSFIAGFESGMIGKSINDYPKLALDADGKLSEPYDDEKYEPVYVRFPFDYGAPDLASKESWFEIYLVSITEYYDDSKGEGVFNDTFVENKILKNNNHIKELFDSEYPGLSPSEQCIKYLADLIDEKYQAHYNSFLNSALINHYLEKVTIKKYPKALMEGNRAEYVKAFEAYYQQILTIYGPYYGYSESNYPIETYAKSYFGISDGSLWKEEVYKIADSETTWQLILHYIIEKENIEISSSEIDAKEAAVFAKIASDFGITIYTLDD